MRRSLRFSLALPLIVALATPAGARVSAESRRPPTGPAVATTDNETPVLYDDDEGGSASGDDPAIWVHPSDSTRSIVLATAKEGGLRLRSRRRGDPVDPRRPSPRADGIDGRYNNVDIAYGLELGGRTVDVAVVSDRFNDQLRFWVIDPAGSDAATPLTEVTAPEQAFLFNPDREAVDDEHTAYGLAVYQPGPGTAYAVADPGGPHRDGDRGDRGAGRRFGYTAVGRLDMPYEFRLPDGLTWVPCEEPGVLPQLEELSVDDNGALYAAQEDVGVWRIQLPLGSTSPVLIDRVADFGIHDVFDEEAEECVPVDDEDTGFGGPNLVADAEGVDVYYGPGATGYVIVSSQGDDRYAVYSTTPENRSLGTFLVRGVGVDDINGSDGLAVSNRPVGQYRRGLLVSHDEPESGPGSTRTATPRTSPSSTGPEWRGRFT